MNRNRQAPESILVIQIARFGDFLQTTPLLAALKASFPGAAVTMLVQTPQAPVARNNPHANEVLDMDIASLAGMVREPAPFGRRVRTVYESLAALNGRRFDLVINVNTSRPAALIAECAAAGVREGPRLGPDRGRLALPPWTTLIMNLMTRRRLIRFNLVDLLAAYAPLPPARDTGLVYPVSARAREAGRSLIGPGEGPVVGFQVGSRHPRRQWPPERFARLAAGLMSARRARIVLLGTREESPLARETAGRLAALHPPDAGALIDLTGRTSIDDLAGVLAGLDLLVTTDTGTMHLAAAVGTPILALFIGPAFCHETGPYGSGHLVLQTDAPCAPCTESRGDCPGLCRSAIRPETALAAAAWMLDGGADGHPVIDESHVRAYRTWRDAFGLICRPWTPAVLTREHALALAIREAGRGLIRPEYASGRRAVHDELVDFRAGPAMPGDLLNLPLRAARRPRPWEEPEWTVNPDLAPLAATARALTAAGAPNAARRLVHDFLRTLGTIGGHARLPEPSSQYIMAQ